VCMNLLGLQLKKGKKERKKKKGKRSVVDKLNIQKGITFGKRDIKRVI